MGGDVGGFTRSALVIGLGVGVVAFAGDWLGVMGVQGALASGL